MNPPEPRPEAREPSAGAGAVRLLLSVATALSLFVVIQNFGLDVLPDQRVQIPREWIRPFPGAKTFAYVFDYDGSEPDRWPSARSRVRLFEDGREYGTRSHASDAVRESGGPVFSHEPGRIVFSASDNTDPRTNGRRYELSAPFLYSEPIGDAGALGFLACLFAWRALTRRDGRPPPPRRPRPGSWPWHLAGATAVFSAGLYCSTGTLAPYAITTSAVVAHSTGYAYNLDHVHFRVLFAFVDGQGRAVWDHAIMLRRILFPVLGWPLMKLLGFEIGGSLTSVALNVAAFVAAALGLRRRIGERGTVLAAWLLALYPGAAYWAGLPYAYALIFPASLLLMLGLMALAESSSYGVIAGVSIAMGVAYLGYDLAVTFVPATLVVLCWRRRFLAAAASAAIQLAPLAAWVYALGHVFRQPLQNDNSGIYVRVLGAFLRAPDPHLWCRQVFHAAAIGCDVFFASNFIFIPALFLLALALNPVTSRIRFHAAEAGVLASSLALFALLNFAPVDTGGWEMRGTWIARIYQPAFAALVVYLARWWQDLPPLGPALRALVVSALAGVSLGDALIVLGPILGNPLRLSETAFYRFYDHTDAHFMYARNLARLGRCPIGFLGKAAVPGESDSWDPEVDDLKDARTALASIRSAIAQNQSALAEVRRAYRQAAGAVAETRSRLYARRLEARRQAGEISAAEAQREAKTADDFLGGELRGQTDAPRTAAGAPVGPALTAPASLGEVQAAIREESARLKAIEGDILRMQDELRAAYADQAQAQKELEAQAAPKAPAGR